MKVYQFINHSTKLLRWMFPFVMVFARSSSWVRKVRACKRKNRNPIFIVKPLFYLIVWTGNFYSVWNQRNVCYLRVAKSNVETKIERNELWVGWMRWSLLEKLNAPVVMKIENQRKDLTWRLLVFLSWKKNFQTLIQFWSSLSISEKKHIQTEYPTPIKGQ